MNTERVCLGERKSEVYERNKMVDVIRFLRSRMGGGTGLGRGTEERVAQ